MVRIEIFLFCIFAARFIKEMIYQLDTLFMDRDGVVNKQIVGGYVQHISQFVFLDQVAEALQILHKKFVRIVLVTNQQGVGKGLCSMEDVEQVHEYMQSQLRTRGCAFDKIYCCPHLAAENCTCRKPKPGMAFQAQKDFPDIDFSRSLMVGDSLSDIQFAKYAGIPAVHVGAIRHPEFEEIQKITPHHFDSLYDFALAMERGEYPIVGIKKQDDLSK